MEQQFATYFIEVLVFPCPAGSSAPWGHPHMRVQELAGGGIKKDSTSPSRKAKKPGAVIIQEWILFMAVSQLVARSIRSRVPLLSNSAQRGADIAGLGGR